MRQSTQSKYQYHPDLCVNQLQGVALIVLKGLSLNHFCTSDVCTCYTGTQLTITTEAIDTGTPLSTVTTPVPTLTGTDVGASAGTMCRVTARPGGNTYTCCFED